MSLWDSDLFENLMKTVKAQCRKMHQQAPFYMQHWGIWALKHVWGSQAKNLGSKSETEVQKEGDWFKVAQLSLWIQFQLSLNSLQRSFLIHDTLPYENILWLQQLHKLGQTVLLLFMIWNIWRLWRLYNFPRILQWSRSTVWAFNLASLILIAFSWSHHDSESNLLCAPSLSLTAIPWTVAHQAPLSVGFPRQEY